jgi:hypothetical protein
MMNGDGVGQATGKEPIERAIGLFVHTPIGLAVMAWKRVPEFVGAMPDIAGQALSKGCAQLADVEARLSEEVRKARMIGQVAVTFGGRQLRREVDARLADVRRTAEGVASFLTGAGPEGRSNGAGPGARPSAPSSPPVTATVTEPSPASPEPPAAKATRARKATKAAPAASVADLPIREYDGLSASQVVSRLTGLTPGELRAVRAYEEASRGRRTILLAIDRLLG